MVSTDLKKFEEEPITRQMILSVLKDYKRPNDKISELVKSGILTIIKNGLYIPGSNTEILKPEPFLISNHLWGPSYVSLDAALSYWGFIPERVYEITAVTLKKSKIYNTKAGRFSYKTAPLPYYSFGIINEALSAKQTILIACPEKALCDKIIMTPGVLLRSISQTLDFLVNDLRIDEDQLSTLDTEKIATWIPDAPKNSSLKIFIKALQSL